MTRPSATTKPAPGGDLEAAVRRAVMGFVHRAVPFKPIDVAAVLESELGAVPLDLVGRLVRRIVDAGLLRPFGYRRSVTQERTRIGVLTTVVYVPPGTRPAGPALPSTHPTRAPLVRPFGYLELGFHETRRLDRQTQSLRRQLSSTAQELVRIGDLLRGVQALVGTAGLARYAERELAMSRDTARRLIQVATVFHGHPALDALAVTRPTVLHALAAPSFPIELREAILSAGGLQIDGKRRTLAELRARDLALARAAYDARALAMRDAQRALAEAERSDTEVARDTAVRLRARLRALGHQPITSVTSGLSGSRAGKAGPTRADGDPNPSTPGD